jgi:hypothetical protein
MVPTRSCPTVGANWCGVITAISTNDRLGLWWRNMMMKSSAGSHKEAHRLPRFGPSVGGEDLLLLFWSWLIKKITGCLDDYSGVDRLRESLPIVPSWLLYSRPGPRYPNTGRLQITRWPNRRLSLYTISLALMGFLLHGLHIDNTAFVGFLARPHRIHQWQAPDGLCPQ